MLVRKFISEDGVLFWAFYKTTSDVAPILMIDGTTAYNFAMEVIRDSDADEEKESL